MLYIIFSILIAYLTGAIPTAYIFGKYLKNVDIRDHGSGNVGATNALRTLGKLPGLAVFVIDILKGTGAILLVPAFVQRVFPASGGTLDGHILLLLGAAAIAGHVWPVFLRFKGGKGVSTSAGVIAALSPVILLGCLVIWGMVFAIWKYVSLASIVAAIALPVFAVLTGKSMDFVVFCAVLCLGGVYAHRSNIRRLIQGTETRIVKVKKR
ncbi:MAG: glycerol-3-phosphate 1-O-acyltransferase PlsY [Candidatus Omnitrophota bacterium]